MRLTRPSAHKLPRSFYDRDTIGVAKELLGKWLVHRTEGAERIGRIVEVEAYLGPHDLAAHSSKGLTERTKIMFGPPGHAYVYFIYGMYHCMNVVTEREGHASAVLVRAVEPVRNIEGRTQGPGLLCKAMGVDRRLNGHDLLSDDFYIAAPPDPGVWKIGKGPRIGVDYARHWARRHLRFYIKGNPFVSRPRRASGFKPPRPAGPARSRAAADAANAVAPSAGRIPCRDKPRA
jgi:DNA-3-methyladenine glycosylase